MRLNGVVVYSYDTIDPYYQQASSPRSDGTKDASQAIESGWRDDGKGDLQWCYRILKENYLFYFFPKINLGLKFYFLRGLAGIPGTNGKNGDKVSNNTLLVLTNEMTTITVIYI